MFIPVIFDISPDRDARYLGEFYHWLYICKQNKWRLIATEEYFISPDEYRMNGRREAYDPDWAKKGKYELPSVSDFEIVKCNPIPSTIIDQIVKTSGSYSDAAISLFRERNSLVENWLENVLKEESEKIEAFIMFREYPSFQYIAKKFKIEILYYDIGTFRPPVYKHTICLDSHGLFGHTELESRYKKFQLENTIKKNVPLFSRKELLALFLERDYLKYLTLLDNNGNYELGIALQSTIFYPFLAENYVNNLDLLTIAKKENIPKENILLRIHPYDVCEASYKALGLPEDSSKTSLEFILKCKKILSTSSNINFEAMLWNRGTYSIANSPFTFQAKLTWMDSIDISFLNFVCFAFFVPYEWLGNSRYLRWRLEKHTETEIYMYHLAYYMNHYGLDEKDLNQQRSLEKILAKRGFSLEDLQKEYIALNFDEMSKEDRIKKELLDRCEHYEGKIEYYKKHIFSLEENIRISQSYIKSLEATVASQKQYIENEERKEYINLCESNLKKQYQYIQKCERDLVSQQQFIQECETQINGQHQYIQECEKRINQQQDYLNQIFASTSWKSTKILRLLGKIIGKKQIK